MARRTYTGTLIAAGPTRALGGGAGRYVVTAAALRQAVAEGLFRGLACFVDHGARPSLRRLLGVWEDVGWDEARQAAVGRLRVYETPGTRPVVEMLEQALDETERPDFGVSLVFYPRLAADGRTVTGVLMVESADLVMFPASAASRIERQEQEPRATIAEGSKAAREEGERRAGSFPRAEAGTILPYGAGSAAAVLRHGPVAELPPCGYGQQVKCFAAWSGGLCSHSDSAATEDNVDENKVVEMGAMKAMAMAAGEEEVTGEGAAGMAAGANGSAQRTVEAHQGARRVRLVAEAPARVAGAASGADGDGAGDAPGGPLERELAIWLDSVRDMAAELVIRASGLPGAVQERLLGGRYESAEEVETAVARARAELAALNEAGVVRLGGVRPGGGGWVGGKVQRTSEGASHRVWVRDGLDEARELVGFFFGAADAPEPPPNLRSFADLYVALTGDVHFRGVFDGGRAQFSGATTSTLPNLAVDAMNRVIVQQFQALDHYRWYERISSVEPNDGTLQDMKWITLGGIGDLPAVNEGAAYTELSVADVKESAAFIKRGGYVGITREMIRNSNIMQLQAIPRALAAAAVRTRSAAVAALFTANAGVGPTLAQDSKALFHADHANLATTALGTDAAAWRAARAECFQHAEVGSAKVLGIFPRYLLVPAELYDTALSILGYGEGMPATYAPEAQGRGFADPRPIPLVVPDWTDAGDWAYVVDPAVYPVIQMSYSQAPGGRRHPIPELFAVVSETSGLMFSNDILPIKVRDEFALGVNGHRGIGKRNVA